MCTVHVMHGMILSRLSYRLHDMPCGSSRHSVRCDFYVAFACVHFEQDRSVLTAKLCLRKKVTVGVRRRDERESGLRAIYSSPSVIIALVAQTGLLKTLTARERAEPQ